MIGIFAGIAKAAKGLFPKIVEKVKGAASNVLGKVSKKLGGEKIEQKAVAQSNSAGLERGYNVVPDKSASGGDGGRKVGSLPLIVGAVMAFFMLK